MAITTIAAALLLAGPYNPSGPRIKFTFTNGKSFVIATDPKGSPKTTAQIVGLVKKKFYDTQKVHRVEGWVIQWGDPASKKGIGGHVGSGGSGTQLPFEDNPASFLKGVVGIAATDAKVGGDSQIFIVLRDSAFLDHDYAILGKVVEGMETVMKVQAGDTIKSATVVPAKKGK